MHPLSNEEWADLEPLARRVSSAQARTLREIANAGIAYDAKLREILAAREDGRSLGEQFVDAFAKNSNN